MDCFLKKSASHLEDVAVSTHINNLAFISSYHCSMEIANLPYAQKIKWLMLLHTIKQAYATLIDEDKRAAYNRMLIDTGQVDAATFSSRNQRRLAAISEPPNASKEKNLSQWVRKKAETPEIRALTKEIQAKELISGRDLKKLREAFGIDLSEIYAITKISNSILSMIEADQFDALPGEVYLKKFLKDYAGILQIDPHHAVQGYLTSMHQRRVEHG